MDPWRSPRSRNVASEATWMAESIKVSRLAPGGAWDHTLALSDSSWGADGCPKKTMGKPWRKLGSVSMGKMEETPDFWEDIYDFHIKTFRIFPRWNWWNQEWKGVLDHLLMAIAKVRETWPSRCCVSPSVGASGIACTKITTRRTLRPRWKVKAKQKSYKIPWENPPSPHLEKPWKPTMKVPYGSKHCLRRYLTLQIIANYTPNTS